jgi:8-oxo-dGTP pyrophosphatase MutT (NUDIX family)
MAHRERVVAYIVRGDEFVVFTHDEDQEPLLESGLQVPAGGIRPSETASEAALREAYEETGLEGLRIVRYLGEDMFDARPVEEVMIRRRFFHLTVDGDPPREWRQVEQDASDGGTYIFRLFWLPLDKAPLVCGSMTALIGRIFDADEPTPTNLGDLANPS